MATIDIQTSAGLGRDDRHESLHDLVAAGFASVGEMLITLFDWQYQARQRRQLLALSDSALKDFGASRADAESEAGKPFWR